MHKIIIYLLLMLVPALAHDANHGLDDWYKSLKSEIGYPCCDGSDAYSVEDPDWKVGPIGYQVRLEGKWIDVPESALVKGSNKAGIAKVWPVYLNGEPLVRCFLPGSGA